MDLTLVNVAEGHGGGDEKKRKDTSGKHQKGLGSVYFSPMKISRTPTVTCRQREMLIRVMMGV